MSGMTISPKVKVFTGNSWFIYFYHNVKVDGKKIGIVKQNDEDTHCKKSWSFTYGKKTPEYGFDSQDVEPNGKYYETPEKAAAALLKYAISRANKKAKAQGALIY